jgi:hypothetical protein
LPDQYPYIISNNKIEPALVRIRTAAKPERVSQELLAKWGFTASNDRALPRVLRMLGFLTENGTPTEAYDRLRDPSDWKKVLAEKIRATYSDLYSIDPNIHKAPDAEVKGAISRITGKEEESVKRYFVTFKALCALADFSEPEARASTRGEGAASANPPAPAPDPINTTPAPQGSHRKSEYHYNIQIHLPVTTDITVYNAIFKSLRDNLGV